MSPSPTEVFQESFAAFQRGDLARMIELAHPDVEVYIPDRPDQQVSRGPEEALVAVATWTEAFEDYSVELLEIEEHGDQIYVLASQSGTSPLAGVRMEERIAYAVTVRDGRISRWEVHTDPANARAALG